MGVCELGLVGFIARLLGVVLACLWVVLVVWYVLLCFDSGCCTCVLLFRYMVLLMVWGCWIVCLDVVWCCLNTRVLWCRDLFACCGFWMGLFC